MKRFVVVLLMMIFSTSFAGASDERVDDVLVRQNGDVWFFLSSGEAVRFEGGVSDEAKRHPKMMMWAINNPEKIAHIDTDIIHITRVGFYNHEVKTVLSEGILYHTESNTFVWLDDGRVIDQGVELSPAIVWGILGIVVIILSNLLFSYNKSLNKINSSVFYCSEKLSFGAPIFFFLVLLVNLTEGSGALATTSLLISAIAWHSIDKNTMHYRMASIAACSLMSIGIYGY